MSGFVHLHGVADPLHCLTSIVLCAKTLSWSVLISNILQTIVTQYRIELGIWGLANTGGVCRMFYSNTRP